MSHQMRLAVSLLAFLTVGAAVAGDDPVADRRQIMLMNSHLEDVALRVISGKYPMEKATAAMKTLQNNMTVFPTLFPMGSDKGYTEASPQIWENMDDFRSLAAKLVTDAKVAEGAAMKGVDAFALAFQAVQADCKGCHSKYDPRRD